MSSAPTNQIQHLFEQALQHQQQGQLQAAIDGYRQLLSQTEHADAYANLGVALRLQGQIEAAIAAYRRALSLEPHNLSALSNLGGAYRALGRIPEALVILEKVLSINPDFTAAHYNLGLAYMDFQEPEKAIQAFDRALALEPDRTDAPFDRATCILQTGDLSAGFAAYESRFEYEPRLKKGYTQPYWDGSPLQGKTLLIYTEQGFGDTLQFCRYIPLIPKEHGKIILQCPPELIKLMQTMEGIDEIIPLSANPPIFHTHISLLSLPHLFQTTLSSIPQTIPYLKAPAKSVRLPAKKSFKIGITWASGHQDVGLRRRRIDPKHFLTLLTLPQTSLFSLQKGPSSKQLSDLTGGALIEDLSPYIADFADTAAWLMQLDLLITADTAIVHLAGALARPVWVLLPYGSEWRWLLERTDSPWYPTVRLFRQTEPENWDKVFQEVLEALQKESLR